MRAKTFQAFACWKIGKLNLTPYHTLLIGLHLCASLLLATTFRRLGADLELSLLGGLLFLVNVAHFRAVQWVSCLAYPLALIFALGALLFFIHYLQDRRSQWQILGAISLALAVFSHAATVVLAPFLAYLSWLRNGTSGRILQATLPLFLTAFASAALMHLYYSNSPQSVEVASDPSLAVVGEKMLHFLGTLFTAAHWITGDLIISSSYPESATQQWVLWVGLLTLVGLFALISRCESTARDWAVWTLLALLPFLFRSNEALSRYLYLASAGSSLLLAWSVRAVLKEVDLRLGKQYARTAFALTALICTAVSVHSLQRAEAYGLYAAGRAHISRNFHASGLAAFKQAVQRDSAILPADVYSRLAISAFLLGESPRAVLTQAASNHPESREVTLVLGISAQLQTDPTLQKQGQYMVANALQTGNIELQQLAAVAFYNLGLYEYGQTKDNARALSFFSRAVQIQPHYPRAHFFMGNCLAAQKQPRLAQKAYRTAVTQQPNLDLAWQNLGFLLAEHNEVAAAVAALEKAVTLQPRHDRSWYLLAQIRRLSGQTAAAQQAIRQALAQKPSQTEYWREYLHLAAFYRDRGQVDLARGIYQQVTQALPQYALAHFQLGQLYYSEGNFTAAIDSLQRAVQLSPKNLDASRLLASARRAH